MPSYSHRFRKKVVHCAFGEFRIEGFRKKVVHCAFGEFCMRYRELKQMLGKVS